MTREQATEILNQLGGKRFITMTGAKDFVYGENGIQFRIGTGAKNKINKVVIKINNSDTYDMEFWRVKGVDTFKIAEHQHVYADMVREFFTFETGFFTTL